MKLLKDRIKKAFDMLPQDKQNQRRLAEYCGVKPPSVNDWFSGATKSLRGESLVKAAEFLQVDELWLATGKGSMARSADKPMRLEVVQKNQRPQHIRLPILEVSPAAGAGREPVDYPAVIDYLEVPEAWAKHRLGRDLSKYRVLPVSGDSMSPTINDGDLVFVDTSVKAFDAEGIYVIVWHGRILIKRLKASLASQRIEIISDNTSNYGIETVTIEELAQLHICGFVKCWWSIKGA